VFRVRSLKNAIQHRAPLGTWTRGSTRRQIHRMTLELSDAELSTAATACRAMAYQEGERAKKMENPTLRGPLRRGEPKNPR
jgi:hypothetical protein